MTFSGSSSGEMSGSDVEMADAPAPRERTNARRAATKVKYILILVYWSGSNVLIP